MKNIKILFLAVCVVLSSCSMKSAATTMSARMAIDSMGALESESDLWIANESIIPLVKLLETMGYLDPENRWYNALMSKVYGNVAFGFFEPRLMSASANEKDAWRKRIERYYKKGYESGIKSLAARFGKGINGSIMDFEAAIARVGKNDLMLLFWTAFDLANWINLNKDDVTAVAGMPKVTAMIDRVIELNPQFVCGSALAFKAAMLASRPKMLGGNPEEAKRLFEEAITQTDGAYLMNKVMYAEWYAIPMHDYKLARRLLSEVKKADSMKLPEQALANQLAKERAELRSKKLGR